MTAGLYVFVLTPVLLVLSISLAKYSAYVDLLRRIAPDAYRNSVALACHPLAGC